MASIVTRGLGRSRLKVAGAFLATVGLGIGLSAVSLVPEPISVPSFLRESPLSFPYDNFYEYTSTSVIALENETLSRFVEGGLKLEPEIVSKVPSIVVSEADASAHIYSHSELSGVSLDSESESRHIDYYVTIRYMDDEALMLGRNFVDHDLLEKIKTQPFIREYKYTSSTSIVFDNDTEYNTTGIRERIREDDDLLMFGLL